ncbi:hypothetical protein [Serratia marcescens]|uniref:hypothetical protein n=1 Tax=Serratia marcescens TaxID=615 RepID=UPI001495A04B|nr:hypothetical protein [Serratia marcescens]
MSNPVKVYLLYKTHRSGRYQPELIDIFSTKEAADAEARKKNSYTELGRAYDYTVKAKKLK